jgi:uncharacterized membrane protein
MAQEKPQAYHIVAYEFDGRKRAKDVVDMIRKGGRANDYKVPAWAVIEVDDKGKAHVSQSGHGGVGTAVGTGVGALLGLIGGPAGLLVWALGGALIGGLAGKYMGHHFDTNELKALTVGMGANTSAIIVIVEDKQIEEMEKALDEYGAKVVTVTMGSQLSGEMATYAAVNLGDNGESAEEPQSNVPAEASPTPAATEKATSAG